MLYINKHAGRNKLIYKYGFWQIHKQRHLRYIIGVLETLRELQQVRLQFLPFKFCIPCYHHNWVKPLKYQFQKQVMLLFTCTRTLSTHFKIFFFQLSIYFCQISVPVLISYTLSKYDHGNKRLLIVLSNDVNKRYSELMASNYRGLQTTEQ